MSEERTQAATPNRNPITTGEYVPDATPEAGSTRPTGPHRPGAAADLPNIPGYAVTHELARGGMGRVLAATDLGFGREVAVKVLLPGFDSGEAAGRFVREARITGRLTHPGIPPAHHLGMLADGSPFLAMKLVRGRTLAALLADRPTPAHDLPRFVGVFEQVCQAVGFAHARGVVHRDLKPANVMVGEFGEVQLMDWGLAYETDDGGGMRAEPGTFGDSSLTAAGAVMGTPAYMAPEQARGELVGAAADVFALGGILCEVLTGSRPFRGSSGAEVVAKAAAGDVSDALARIDACGADAELIDVARRCLSPAATDRPADGTAVAGLVAAYRAGVEERLRTAERERAAAEAKAEEEANTRREAEARALEQRRRKRVQLWLAAAAVLLVAGAGGVAVWRVDEEGKKRTEAARLEGEELERRKKNSDAVGELLDRAKSLLTDEDAVRAAPLLTQAARRKADGDATDHDDRLAAYQRDLAMLGELDGVNDYRWAPDGDGRMPSADAVARRWADVFARYGIVAGTTPLAEAVARVNGSTIRPALVAGLDGWLVRSRSSAVLELLEAIDSEPFRNEVRRLMASGDTFGLVAVAGRGEWAVQPSGLVVAFADAHALPDELRREHLLRLVLSRRADFSLLMQLGRTYPMNTAEGAGERTRWFQAAAALRAENPGPLYNLAVTLLDRKDYDAAERAFRERIRLNPTHAAPHNGLGNVLHDRKDLTGAEAEYRVAIRLDPTDAIPHNGLGNVLSDRKDLDGAAAEYREAIRLDPTYAAPHHGLGNVLYHRKDVDGAAAEYREAIRLDTKYARAHSGLGNVLRDRKDLDGAAAAFREAIRLDPTDAAPHHGLGNVLFHRKDLDGATAAYREAIRLDPKQVLPHIGLGNVLNARKDLAGAEAAYREAMRLDPTSDAPHYGLGNVLYSRKAMDGAAAEYREAIRLDPKHARSHHGLGNVLRDRKDLDGAAAAYREAIRLDPTYSRPHFELGHVFYIRKDLERAAAEYREAIRLDPTDALPHNNLGVLLHDRMDLEGAAAALREAIRLDPTDARPHNNLGVLLLDRKDLDGAAAAFREAIRLDPTDARPHFNLALVLHGRKDLEGAAAAFREVIRLEPKDALPRNNLGLMYEALLQLDQAEAAYREAVRLNPRYAAAHANLGDVLRKQTRYAEAVDAYRAALAIQPNLVDARAGLNYCLRVQRGEVPTAPPPRAVTR